MCVSMCKVAWIVLASRLRCIPTSRAMSSSTMTLFRTSCFPKLYKLNRCTNHTLQTRNGPPRLLLNSNSHMPDLSVLHTSIQRALALCALYTGRHGRQGNIRAYHILASHAPSFSICNGNYMKELKALHNAKRRNFFFLEPNSHHCIFIFMNQCPSKCSKTFT